jgi:hypothetical protein
MAYEGLENVIFLLGIVTSAGISYQTRGLPAGSCSND